MADGDRQLSGTMVQYCTFFFFFFFKIVFLFKHVVVVVVVDICGLCVYVLGIVATL